MLIPTQTPDPRNTSKRLIKILLNKLQAFCLVINSFKKLCEIQTKNTIEPRQPQFVVSKVKFRLLLGFSRQAEWIQSTF